MDSPDGKTYRSTPSGKLKWASANENPTRRNGGESNPSLNDGKAGALEPWAAQNLSN